MDISKFKADEEKAEGVLIPLDETTKVLLAYTGSSKHQKALNKIFRKYRVALQNKMLDIEQQRRIMCEVLAETTVLGWEGMTENGDPIPYSKEAALRLLQEYPVFYTWVTDNAEDLDNFRSEVIKEDTENLSNA